MATQYSVQGNVMQDSGVNLNNDRRMFDFGERVAELAPEQSPFFTYLSKVAKKPTDDPVFKFLEKRHQWQRRNFDVTAAISAIAFNRTTHSWNIVAGDNLFLDCRYDKYGREVAATAAVRPEFLVDGANQMIALKAKYVKSSVSYDIIAYYKLGSATGTVDNSLAAKTKIVTATFVKAMYVNNPTAALGGEVVPTGTETIAFEAGGLGQLIGSSWAEGTLSPDGWKDEFYNREGYCQIFKTAVPLFSGTTLATRYRGDSNEYMRVYQEKLMEHKMDIEHALLFGIGSSDEAGTGPARKTWGIVPFTEIYGKTKVFTNASTYDDFLDAMEDVFAPEGGNSGDKLVLCSRKVLTWLNKLGGASFLGNTMALGHKVTTSGGSNPYQLDIQNIKGAFGHNVTQVNTLYGNLHFVADHLFRGPWEQYAIMVDLKNVAYRPLAANGYNRDTFIEMNVQANDMDGRKDMIITEAGLEVSLPETHTVMKFYNL